MDPENFQSMQHGGETIQMRLTAGGESGTKWLVAMKKEDFPLGLHVYDDSVS